MSYTTQLNKGYYGWSATSYIPMDEAKRSLKVTTMKSSRGLVYASVQAVEKGDMFESFVLFGDFSKNIQTFPEIKRVTDKVISEAHNKALQGIEEVLKEANQFYEQSRVKQ